MTVYASLACQALMTRFEPPVLEHIATRWARLTSAANPMSFMALEQI